MRDVFNTIFYLVCTGCQWDTLAHDLLPKSTIYEYFAKWLDDGTRTVHGSLDIEPWPLLDARANALFTTQPRVPTDTPTMSAAASQRSPSLPSIGIVCANSVKMARKTPPTHIVRGPIFGSLTRHQRTPKIKNIPKCMNLSDPENGWTVAPLASAGIQCAGARQMIKITAVHARAESMGSRRRGALGEWGM
jgi:hypothetical protein